MKASAAPKVATGALVMISFAAALPGASSMSLRAGVVDRLGRSLQHLVAFLGEMHAKGVDLYLHVQGLDTGTPAGRAMFQMLGVFSEFERAMIVERVKAGLGRALSQGKRLGRPLLSDTKQQRVRDLLAAGTGIVKTAHIVGCGVSVVQRLKAETRPSAVG